MGRHHGGAVINILATLMMLEIAAAAAFAGYVILTQRISRDQLWLARKVYQGDVTSETLAEAERWRDHLVQQAAREKEAVSGDAADRKLLVTQMQTEASRLGLQWQLDQLKTREDLLAVKMQELEQKRQTLEALEKRVDEKQRQLQTASGNEAFQKMARILDSMKPAELKRMLLGLDDGTVVDFLRNYDPRKAGKLYTEFQTPQELETYRRWMEMLKSGQVAM
ncbi:MAG TPA: hypothetical protein PLP01_12380 [Phycisphaerae bacterium]|nr:hypothetical protein [Phycisphaerae bacterium]HOI56040.1 hypothetical protein [Phycisphaerae bacterium]